MGWNNGFLKFGRTRRQALPQAGVDLAGQDLPAALSGRFLSADTVAGDHVDPQIAEDIKLRQKQLMLRYVMNMRAR